MNANTQTTHNLLLSWRTNGGQTKPPKGKFVKPEFMKLRRFTYSSRSDLTRFFMNYFLPKTYTQGEIHSITSFLRNMGLSRAERHAVIYKLGFRYCTKTNSYSIGNLKINGYYNHPKRLHAQQTKEKE
jgi:hypothetical protein